MHDAGARTYIGPLERDIARLKLLRLDPRQRHVRYDLTKVRNLADLWTEVDRARQSQAAPHDTVYRLASTAAVYDAALAKLPPDIRVQMEQYQQLAQSMQGIQSLSTPQARLAKHAVIGYVALLMHAPDGGY